MAEWNGGGDPGDGARPQLQPDSEQQVIRETEDVVKNFMVESYRHDSINAEPELRATTPPVPEFMNFTSSPLSTEARVGRQLATIGDDINDRYANQFNDMVRLLNLSPDTAYEAFAGVARKLFSDGTINWGRIVTLLCFGYKIAVKVLQSRTKAFASFIKKIVNFVVKFIISERIAKWIADQGGWIAALAQDAIPSVGFSTLAVIMGLGIISAVVAIARVKRG